MKMVKIGDSYSFGVKLKSGAALSGYSCDYEVRRDNSGAIVYSGEGILSTIDGEEVFLVTLLPVISETLVAGKDYTLAAQLSSNDGLFRKEVCQLLRMVSENVS